MSGANRTRAAWLTAVGLVPAFGPAQDAAGAAGPTVPPAAVSLVDGTFERAAVRRVVGSGAGAELELAPWSGAGRKVPIGQVLAIHGTRPSPTGPVRVHLVGGDVLCGELGAGDSAGETFTVDSPTLGVRSVPVDRLRVILFDARVPPQSRPGAVGDRLREFAIPDGTDAQEAVFRPARRGFDMVLGEIHRFTADGVAFAVGGAEPRVVPFDELAAVALRDGDPRESAPGAFLVTRTGDRVGVDFLGADGGRFRFRLEGGDAVELTAESISALTFLGDDRRFLSDLTPETVEETSYFGEAGEPLYPFALDRSVTGEPLGVGGLGFGKGLGVHSRSRLSFRVPEGYRSFTALCGIDDSVLDLDVRADARVAILVDGEPVAELESLRSGRPPHAFGIVPVRAGSLLTLEVEFGEGLDLGDRVDWLNAVLLR